VRLRHRVTGVASGRDPVRVLIGGIGYRFQGDLSFGIHVSDRLLHEELPDHVEVMDLGYGALYVAQDLAHASPPYTRVVLVSAAVRGRAPGLYDGPGPAGPAPATADALPGLYGPGGVQERILEAGAGVIDLDHVLVIGSHFGALPFDLRVIELEPTELHRGDGLSELAGRLLPAAVARARRAALEPALSRN
jgi:hypothetical protein